MVREEGGFERFRWRLRRVTTDGAVEADSLDANESARDGADIDAWGDDDDDGEDEED